MNRSIVGVSAALVAAMGAPVCGAIYEFTFTGTTTSTTGSPAGDWVNVEVGQPVMVRYWFDSGAPDQSPAANTGRFAIQRYRLTIGDASRGTTEEARISKQLFSWVHAYFAIAEWEDAGSTWRCTVGLEDFFADAWDGQGDLLPTSVTIGDFAEREIRLQEIVASRGGPGFEAVASLTGFTSRVVPAPGTACIVSVLAMWSGARRRRETHRCR